MDKHSLPECERVIQALNLTQEIMNDLNCELSRDMEDRIDAQFQSTFRCKVRKFNNQYDGVRPSAAGWEFLRAYSFLYNKFVDYLYGPGGVTVRRQVRQMWIALVTDTPEGQLVH